jgi:hypothetical protein
VGRGVLGSYPHFIFAVDVSQIDAFPQALAAVRDETDFAALVETWGVRCTSPALWPTVDSRAERAPWPRPRGGGP